MKSVAKQVFYNHRDSVVHALLRYDKRKLNIVIDNKYDRFEYLALRIYAPLKDQMV